MLPAWILIYMLKESKNINSIINPGQTAFLLYYLDITRDGVWYCLVFSCTHIHTPTEPESDCVWLHVCLQAMAISLSQLYRYFLYEKFCISPDKQKHVTTKLLHTYINYCILLTTAPVRNPLLLSRHKWCELAPNPLQVFVFWFKNAALHLDWNP